jgi:inosine-uridine nucleoside N-ribohydrolase
LVDTSDDLEAIEEMMTRHVYQPSFAKVLKLKTDRLYNPVHDFLALACLFVPSFMHFPPWYKAVLVHQYRTNRHKSDTCRDTRNPCVKYVALASIKNVERNRKQCLTC